MDPIQLPWVIPAISAIITGTVLMESNAVWTLLHGLVRAKLGAAFVLSWR